MMRQWDGLRQNLGEWRGSFTHFSPDGEVVKDTPSLLRLTESEDGQTIHLRLTRFPTDAPPYNLERSLTYPHTKATFFPTGAFAQGSTQWSFAGQSGAELAFLHGDRRLRLVQLFDGQIDGNSSLSSITLIHETRADSNVEPSPSVTVADLVGQWRGTAVTLSATSDPVELATELTLTLTAPDQLTQTLSFMPKSPAVNEATSSSFPDSPGTSQRRKARGSAPSSVQTVGYIRDNGIWFGADSHPVRVLLLPDGGSITTPMPVKRDRSFFIEAGWLVSPTHRQRLIRRYSATGQWLDQTLVQEFKVQDSEVPDSEREDSDV